MADMTIPQTKIAQAMKNYDGELPPHIVEADQAARAAALTIRHLDSSGRTWRSMLAYYSGTKAQISAFLDLNGPHEFWWPSSLRGPSYFYTSDVGRLSIFRITESRFAVQLSGDIAAQGASKEIGGATTSANVIDFATARRRRMDGLEPGPLRPRPAA